MRCWLSRTHELYSAPIGSAPWIGRPSVSQIYPRWYSGQIIGSWRYCVNEPEMDVAGKAIFPKLMDLMWKRTRDGQLYVLDFGFVLRPQDVQVEKYKKDYNDLRARLQGYLDAASAAKQKGS